MKWRRLRRVFATTIRARFADGHHVDGPSAGSVRGLGERFIGGLDEHAVAHRDDALRDARHATLVGDDDERHAVLRVELAEEVDHFLAGLGVEVAGRLVAQQQLRRAEQRARDRDALLLAARQLARPAVREVGEPDAAQRLAAALLDVRRVVRERRRDDHVAETRQVIEQVERLEHEADRLVAELARACASPAAMRVDTEHLDLAGVGLIEAADDVEQRRLAGARLADERDQLAVLRRRS